MRESVHQQYEINTSICLYYSIINNMSPQIATARVIARATLTTGSLPAYLHVCCCLRFSWNAKGPFEEGGGGISTLSPLLRKSWPFSIPLSGPRGPPLPLLAVFAGFSDSVPEPGNPLGGAGDVEGPAEPEAVISYHLGWLEGKLCDKDFSSFHQQNSSVRCSNNQCGIV